MKYISRKYFIFLILLCFKSQIFSFPHQRINDLLFLYNISSERSERAHDILCDKLSSLCAKAYELKGQNKHSDALSIFFALREFLFSCNANCSDEQLNELEKFFESKKLIDKEDNKAKIKCCMLRQAKEFNSCIRECSTSINENTNEEERRLSRFIREAEQDLQISGRRSVASSSTSSLPSSPPVQQRRTSWWCP